MTTIYTSKKTGAQFTNLTVLENGKIQLTSVEDPTDVITTTESVLKRWYKKSIEVDFTTAGEKPEDTSNELVPMPGSDKLAELAEEYNKPEAPKPVKAKKSGKKQSKPRAKTYEEQKWGLGHQRISSETFCDTLNITDVEYSPESQTVSLMDGADRLASRRAWKNELTGSVWFRFQNYEYELTDVKYIDAEVA